MKKSTLLKSINKCVQACENLATMSSHSTDYKMCRDCLGRAIDCADSGMILIMKLAEDENQLHRNLVKQYISYCKTCAAVCSKYDSVIAEEAVRQCKASIQACEEYVSEHIHCSQYAFIPNSPAFLVGEKLVSF